MAESLLLGIDLGTTMLKACVFNRERGGVVAQASARLPVRVLENGGREQDTAAIQRALRRMLARLAAETGKAWRRIEGIGVAAQGGSTIIATRAGKPLTPMLLWNDGRAQQQRQAVSRAYGAAFWRRLSLRETPPEGLARLLWLREHAPHLLQDGNIHVGAGDYLFHLLTGVWRQEAGSATQIGPYNARTGKLDAAPLGLLKLTLAFFPPLREGHATTPLSTTGAAWTGLPAGIPVAGPYIDQEAGYLSASAAQKNPLQLSLGTAWVGNFIIGKNGGYSPAQLVLPGYSSEERLVVQPLLAGNAAWEWGLSAFLRVPLRQALKRADAIMQQRLLPPPGLCVIPYMAQPNPFSSSALGGGAIIGAGLHTTSEDLLRAVACGLTFELRRVFEDLRASRAAAAAVLTGGAANGFFFRELLAILLRPLPVFWQRDADLAAARGAVFAFSEAAARGELEQITPSEELQSAVDDSCAGYFQIFDRFYGALPAAKPYKLKRSNHAATRQGWTAAALPRTL